eukprot:scaffold1243_cov403-Prasinococcus_capsulatus_cf.AAC.8
MEREGKRREGKGREGAAASRAGSPIEQPPDGGVRTARPIAARVEGGLTGLAATHGLHDRRRLACWRVNAHRPVAVSDRRSCNRVAAPVAGALAAEGAGGG